MSATLRKLLIGVPVTLLFSAACFAQMTIIEGDVKGEDGKPLKDAVIKIDRKDMKGSYNTKSDKKGHYIYTGIPKGSYSVSLEVGGKAVDSVNIPMTNTAESNVVDFDMKAIVARTKAAAAGGAPAALTKEQERSMTPEQKAAYEKGLKGKE